MAAWQYDLFIIPRQKIEQLGCVGSISGELYGQTAWWDGSVSPQDVATRIDTFLSKGDGWSGSVLTWGVEDGNRIDLLVEESLIEELQVRLDMRDLSEGFLQEIVRLAGSLEGVFCSGDGTLIAADMPSLAKAMAESDAARFVADPSRFLENLADERD